MRFRFKIFALAVLAGLVPARIAGAVSIVDAIQYAFGTNNSAASVGQVGEFVQSIVPYNGATITLTPSGTNLNVTSIAVSAGQWLCFGNVASNGGSTTITQEQASISTVSQTPSAALGQTNISAATTVLGPVVAPPTMIQVSAPTTVYLVAQAVFTGSGPVTWGSLTCLRIR